MNLLSQVRAVKEGMVVGCWVGGSTLVRFTIGTCERSTRDPSWLTLHPTDATTPAASPAVLLTYSTELLVAPKSRFAPPPSAPKTHDLSANGAQPSSSKPLSPEWDRLRRKLVRLLPLEGLQSTSGERNDDDTTPPTSPEAFVSPALYRSLTAAAPTLRVNLIYHARPVAKGSGSASGEPATPSSPQTNGNGKEEEASKDTKRKEVEVLVKEARGVPNGHVWVSETVRKELALASGAEGTFELLRCG